MTIRPILLIFLGLSLACGREGDFDILDDLENIVVKSSFQDSVNKVALRNSYIVTFKTDYASGPSQFRNYFSEYQFHYADLSRRYLSDPGISKISFLTSIDLSDPSSFDAESRIGAPKALQLAWNADRVSANIGVIARVDFSTEPDADELLAQWTKAGRIWFAEPNYQSTLSADDWSGYQTEYENLIKDNADRLYWLTKVNAVGAFASLAKIPNSFKDQPIIAVMDSGVDVLHPNLDKRIWENKDLGQGRCGSNDKYGCNTTEQEKGVLGDGDVAPFGSGGYGKACPPPGASQCVRNCCHGTHVAGIIAAKPKGDIAGICPICQIMVLRVVGKAPGNEEGTILDSSIIGAFKYLMYFRGEQGLAVRVVNASFGKFQRSRAVSVLVRALKDTPKRNKGTLVIGAAGNEDSSKMQYPAAYKDSIAVANIHPLGPKHESSNFGRWVDISAPGTAIVSTVPGGGSEPKSGTSMAAPVVSGIAGLVLATNGSISVSGLRDRIIEGADETLYDDDVNKSYLVEIPGESFSMPLLGAGMVDAQNSVKGVVTDRPAVAVLDRVNDSCGVALTQKSSLFSLYGLLMFGLIPFLFLFFRKKSA